MYLLEQYPKLESCIDSINLSIQAIIESYKNGGKVIIAGNGGSASDSEHIAGELLKSFVKKRPINKTIANSILSTTENKQMAEYIINNLEMPLEAIALTSHSSLSTAFINDRDPYLVFAQQMLAFGKKGDIFIAISTSGNAKNIVLAATVAKSLGVKVISLTGEHGGKLANMSNIAIKAPATETYKVQEYHLPIYHHICLEVEAEFFPEAR